MKRKSPSPSSPPAGPPSPPGFVRRIRTLPPPADYFTGRNDPPRLNPREILCFCRTSRRILEESRATDRDYHHRFVLLVAVEGEGTVCRDATAHPLKEGEAVLVFPFQFHHYLNVRPESPAWLFLTFETAWPDRLLPLQDARPLALGTRGQRLLEHVVDALSDPAADATPSLHLELLLLHLLGAAASRPLPPPLGRTPADPTAAGLFQRINAYAIAHTGEPLRLKALAATLGTSESHLRARFRQLTGQSLGRHLRKMRLLRACHLLHEAGLNVTEIATQCGFDSLFSFSRAFKQYTGVSPLAYRQRLTRAIKPPA